MSEMPAPAKTSNCGVPGVDFAFLNDAMRSQLIGETLGGMAKEKASDERVKKFGERMLSDHHDANEEHMRVATAKGIGLRTDLDRSDQNEIDQLNGLSGSNFDIAFMSRVVSDYRSDVTMFRKETDSGEDPDVQALVQKILPMLQEHLKMAESLQESIEKDVADRSGGAKR